jgi:hypothetical protein
MSAQAWTDGPREIADGRIDKGNAATDLTRQAAGVPKRTASERSRE